jgi:hypothetical protein
MPLCPRRFPRSQIFVLLSLQFVVLLFSSFRPVFAQGDASPTVTSSAEIFRLERVPVSGGAELITIHARLDGIDSSEERKWVPMVTVLRDTLGDEFRENDRIRYV